MDQLLLFSVLGFGAGSLIAGLGLAIVLSFRGSGQINLAAGAIAMVAGYAYWSLRTGEYGPTFGTVPALLISFGVLLVVALLVESVAVRPLRRASPLAKLVASLGVLLVAQASILIAFGPEPKPQPKVLPNGAVEVFGSSVPVSRFILPAMVVAVTAALAALYRFSAFGVASRASSENEAFALLAGLTPSTLSLAGTVGGTVVAGGVGIVAASVAALDPATLPVQVAPALAAALLARFTSWWITCFAGIGLGVGYSLVDYASTQAWFPTADGVAIPGAKELLVFLLIIVIMFVRGSRLPGRGDIVELRLPAVPRPRRPMLAAAAAAVVGGVALIVFPFDFRQALVNSLIGVVMALSLVVITGFVGQISVVQLGLAGVAGFAVAHASTVHGLGFPVAAVAGIAAATAFGLLAAVSALRVRGVSLAIVTLAAAAALTQFGFTNPLWGGGLTGSPVPEPHLFGLDVGQRAAYRGVDGNLPSPIFGFGVLAVVILLCLLTIGIRRSGAGQRMLAVRSNERAAAAAGISVRNTKLAAFGASSLIAGTAGVLYAYNFGSVSAARFDLLTALALIAFAYVGGITMVSGAVLAGLLSNQALVPFALDRWFGLSGNYFLLFGGVMLLFTLVRNPEGVAGALARTINARRTSQPDPAGPDAADPDAAANARPASIAGPAAAYPVGQPVKP